MAVTIHGYPGLVFLDLGPLLVDDSETVWTGIQVECGLSVVAVYGDSRRRLLVDPAEIEPIDDDKFCAACGQIGCCWDGREED
jgi:hypothetical protein